MNLNELRDYCNNVLKISCYSTNGKLLNKKELIAKIKQSGGASGLINQIGGNYDATIAYISANPEYRPILPMLNIPYALLRNELEDVQAVLGLNGWECVNLSPGIGHDFHKNGLTWTPDQLDSYFTNGMLREIILLETGVNIENPLMLNRDKELTNEMTVIIPVYNLLNIRDPEEGSKYNWYDMGGLKHRLADEMHNNDLQRYIQKHPKSPIPPKYLERKYGYSVEGHSVDSCNQSSIALNTQDVILQIYYHLCLNKTILFHARRYHRQKVIVEKLHAIVVALNGRAPAEDLGTELRHQDSICDTFQSILHNSIKDILRYALNIYIKPFIDFYIGDDEATEITIKDPETRKIPDAYDPSKKIEVNMEFIYAYDPPTLLNRRVQEINEYKFYDHLL